jgi:hypothetical protein
VKKEAKMSKIVFNRSKSYKLAEMWNGESKIEKSMLNKIRKNFSIVLEEKYNNIHDCEEWRNLLELREDKIEKMLDISYNIEMMIESIHDDRTEISKNEPIIKLIDGIFKSSEYIKYIGIHNDFEELEKYKTELSDTKVEYSSFTINNCFDESECEAIHKQIEIRSFYLFDQAYPNHFDKDFKVFVALLSIMTFILKPNLEILNFTVFLINLFIWRHSLRVLLSNKKYDGLDYSIDAKDEVHPKNDKCLINFSDSFISNKWYDVDKANAIRGNIFRVKNKISKYRKEV